MDSSDDTWFDEQAGPVVRPYSMTGGRTRPVRDGFDLIAIVVATRSAGEDSAGLDPEHLAILELCRRPLSVAEIASELDAPIGVVRVLLGDLLDSGMILVRGPLPVAQPAPEHVLREVINGLRAL